jgi:hypothetical protein
MREHLDDDFAPIAVANGFTDKSTDGHTNAFTNSEAIIITDALADELAD